MNSITVVISDNKTIQIISNDEIIHISVEDCRDFDYSSSKITEILEDGNINGPDQMRLVKHIAESFLISHDKHLDMPDQYLIIKNEIP